MRGKRTKYVEEIEKQAAAMEAEQVAGIDTKLLLMIGLGVFLISVIILYFVMRKKKEGKK